MTITLYHNPGCGTSRKTLELIRGAGHEPLVIEYLKTGWTRAVLQDILAKLGLRPRDILRVRGTAAEALGLLAVTATDEMILNAMIADPILVERPIVISPKGARLCRPQDQVLGIL